MFSEKHFKTFPFVLVEYLKIQLHFPIKSTERSKVLYHIFLPKIGCYEHYCIHTYNVMSISFILVTGARPHAESETHRSQKSYDVPGNPLHGQRHPAMAVVE